MYAYVMGCEFVEHMVRCVCECVCVRCEWWGVCERMCCRVCDGVCVCMCGICGVGSGECVCGVSGGVFVRQDVW